MEKKFIVDWGGCPLEDEGDFPLPNDDGDYPSPEKEKHFLIPGVPMN